MRTYHLRVYITLRLNAGTDYTTCVSVVCLSRLRLFAPSQYRPIYSFLSLISLPFSFLSTSFSDYIHLSTMPYLSEPTVLLPDLQGPTKNGIPSYLLRVYTSPDVFPPAESLPDQQGSPLDPFSKLPAAVNAIVNTHMRGKMGPGYQYSNMTSWTSSMLVALQDGLMKIPRDLHSPAASNVFLLVIDTGKFPSGTFIKDSELVGEIKRHISESEGKPLGDFLTMRRSNMETHSGEYLSLGELNIEGKCIQISFQELISNGLFNLHVHLGKECHPNDWMTRVSELRRPFGLLHEPPRAKTSEIFTAIRIGCYFQQDQWAIPVAMMLLALKPRKGDDSAIMQAFSKWFSDSDVLILSGCQFDLNAADIDQLPEVKQYTCLLYDLVCHFYQPR